MTNRISGAEALLAMLKAYEVRHVFGLCGDSSLPFYDAVRRQGIGLEHILVRDERTAAYMADAYARTTGRIGVCEGPSGGGATYILPGLVEANESSSAVLAITTDIPIASRGRFALTELDQQALMSPLTKWNAVAVTAELIPRLTRAAFSAMTTGRPGAAHLALPYDVQHQPVEESEIWAESAHVQFPAWRCPPASDAVDAVVNAILSAQHPMILCGGGVVAAGAEQELQDLAERLDIIVATSVSGQGALPETHPNCIGVVGSNGGTDETGESLSASDLVVLLGCRAGSTTTSRWTAPSAETRIVHIDIDPMAIGANYRTEVPVLADLKLALAAINAELETINDPISFGAADEVKRLIGRKFAKFSKLAQSQERPILPERIVSTLQAILPKDAVIAVDPGTPCPYFSAYYRLPAAGRHLLTNRAHGALGYALPAALGAWFGRPDRKTVAVMGDGSFGFTCGELETVVRYGAPLLIIVLSNSSFGWIRASQYADYEAQYHNVDFLPTNHAAIASDFGLRSWRVEEPNDLKRTLAEAVCHDGPALVDIVCQPLEQAAAPVSRWMG